MHKAHGRFYVASYNTMVLFWCRSVGALRLASWRGRGAALRIASSTHKITDTLSTRKRSAPPRFAKGACRPRSAASVAARSRRAGFARVPRHLLLWLPCPGLRWPIFHREKFTFCKQGIRCIVSSVRFVCSRIAPLPLMARAKSVFSTALDPIVLPRGNAAKHAHETGLLR